MTAVAPSQAKSNWMETGCVDAWGRVVENPTQRLQVSCLWLAITRQSSLLRGLPPCPLKHVNGAAAITIRAQPYSYHFV